MEEYLRPTDYLIFGVWTFLMFLMALNWQKNKALYQVKKKELEITNVYDQYTEELLQTVIKKQHDFDNYLQALLAQFEIATTLDELVYDQKKFIFEIIILISCWQVANPLLSVFCTQNLLMLKIKGAR